MKYFVATFTRDGDTINFDNRSPDKPTIEEAVEEWKERACQEAELALGDDEEAVDRNQQEIYDMKNDILAGRIAESEFFDNFAGVATHFNNTIPVLCYDIEWDADEPAGLPNYMIVHAAHSDYMDGDADDEIGNVLSDATGFCHKGFKSVLIA